jgi:hypothetical protein
MLQIGMCMPSGCDNATRQQDSVTVLQQSKIEGRNQCASMGYNAKEAQLPCQGATTQPLDVAVMQQQDKTTTQECNMVEVGLWCPKSRCQAQLATV